MSLQIVKRSDKVAYMEVKDGATTKIHRMKGFTSLSKKANPIEYSRQYIDEAFETTDIVGMSISQDFEFDQAIGDPVSEFLVDIIDEEKLGSEAIVNIILIDFTKPVNEEEGTKSYKAKKRAFAVIPDSSGDGTDAFKYSGTFKVAGDTIDGTATSTDKFEKTAVFVEI